MSDNLFCKVCRSTNIKEIGKPRLTSIDKKFIRKDYKIVQCGECEYYFVNPQIDLTLAEWEELYGSNYFLRMTDWHEEERLTSIDKRLNWLAERCDNKVENFLDVGCGEGYALLNAKKRGWNAYGFDISDNRLDEVKKGDIDFRHGDLFSAKYEDNFFDVAYMDSVLEHLINPLEYLKELNRILKKGGVLYIGIPNEDSLFNDVRRWINILSSKKDLSVKLRPFEAPYHVSGFTDKAIHKIADEANLKVDQLVNFAAKFEFKKYHPNTKGFWIHLFMVPVDVTAALIKREVYYEAVLKK